MNVIILAVLAVLIVGIMWGVTIGIGRLITSFMLGRR